MKKILSVLFLFSLLLSGAIAQNQSVDGILKNYFETIGGVDAWKKIKTMRITGESQNSGLTFPVTVSSMWPNLQRIDVNIQGQKFIDSFDGEVAWNLNPFMGGTEPTKKNEEETKEAAKQMFEDEFIDYKDKGHTVTFEGEEEIEGAKVYKLKMLKKSGDEVLYFFDAENYVPIMIRAYVGAGPMKGKAVDTFVSNYDEVDGVVVPFFMEQKLDGQVVMNLKSTKVEFNVPMNKEAFVMPKK